MIEIIVLIIDVGTEVKILFILLFSQFYPTCKKYKLHKNDYIFEVEIYFKEMNFVTWNGYIGGILSACIFIPQLYKIYTSKRCNDISWWFIILSIIASVSSLVYYEDIHADPMTYTNIFSLFTRFILAGFKFYYDGANLGKNEKNSLEENLLEPEC